nr:MAG TPA: hypothetical protein [Caudoviricetes sp.]
MMLCLESIRRFLISYMEFYLDLILYIWNALFTARS